jgi:TonB family protein
MYVVIKLLLLSVLPVITLLFFAGCQIEGSMDRFGRQMLESVDNTPVTLVEINEIVKPPEGVECSDGIEQQMIPVSTPAAAYPERLRSKGVQGKATVLLVTDTSGLIIDPRISYATDTSFASALLDAVKNWKVDPCRKDGKPVPCYKFITIDFMLNK